jgi:hypothetical protein
LRPGPENIQQRRSSTVFFTGARSAPVAVGNGGRESPLFFRCAVDSSTTKPESPSRSFGGRNDWKVRPRTSSRPSPASTKSVSFTT